jgi:hypothetical protein
MTAGDDTGEVRALVPPLHGGLPGDHEGEKLLPPIKPSRKRRRPRVRTFVGTRGPFGSMPLDVCYLLFSVIAGKSSVRNGTAGRPALL